MKITVVVAISFLCPLFHGQEIKSLCHKASFKFLCSVVIDLRIQASSGILVYSNQLHCLRDVEMQKSTGDSSGKQFGWRVAIL